MPSYSKYREWKDSNPFDCGRTIADSLNGYRNSNSQANGALMRVCPIGIFGINHSLEQVKSWAEEDARLTHPNPICVQVNGLFAMLIATAIRTTLSPVELYDELIGWADMYEVEPIILDRIKGAMVSPPDDYMENMGWVLVAFHNALYQLLHAPSLEDGVIDTVMRGGDTDTNAAITGALLGAVYGEQAIPKQWLDSILSCRPTKSTGQPRPERYWPVNVCDLATDLIVRS